MANKYLMQQDAPISTELWELFNNTMIETAKHQLVGRKILPTKGPFGLGLRQISLTDVEVGPGIFSIKTLPLTYIHRTFLISKRDLASYEKEGVAIDLSSLIGVTKECARIEDRLIFEGITSKGLLNSEGVLNVELKSWEKVGEAVNNIIEAVTRLDEAGFHGPYTLALAPERYNLLFRRYESGNQTELEHLRTLVKSVHKAPILKDTGVLISESEAYASIIIGQDMSIGFIGPVGEKFEFSISESLALLLNVPASVCVLSPK
ncbi:MAG: family 1 encapsulin nanocompartment shell protein [Pseudothermotoga sp.]